MKANDPYRIRQGGEIIGGLWSAVAILEAAHARAESKGPGEARAEIKTLLDLARRTAARVKQAYDAVENR